MCIMYQHNDQFYDTLSMATTILQLVTIMITSSDSSNRELMQELQRQDREYLEKIIEQNNEILKQLAKLAD